MDVRVTDARELTRYEARVDGKLAAIADYIPTDDLLAFTHTRCCRASRAAGSAAPWSATRWTTCGAVR
jgi:hypothetical protein